jgi:hypothetical protein
MRFKQVDANLFHVIYTHSSTGTLLSPFGTGTTHVCRDNVIQVQLFALMWDKCTKVVLVQSPLYRPCNAWWSASFGLNGNKLFVTPAEAE